MTQADDLAPHIGVDEIMEETKICLHHGGRVMLAKGIAACNQEISYEEACGALGINWFLRRGSHGGNEGIWSRERTNERNN